jgi:hypothetical protein
MKNPDPEHQHKYRKGQTNAAGQTICGAKNRSGKPCGVTFLMENGRCKGHGGKSPKGTASPQFRHGRYSKYLSPLLMERYDAGLQDDQLLELSDEIVLVRTRITQLLQRTDAGISAQFISNLRKQWVRLKGAIRASNAETMGEAIEELDSLIHAAHTDYAAWGDIDRQMGRLQHLIDGKRKHEVDTQQMITLRQAEAFFMSLQLIIMEELADQPSIRSKIGDRIRKLEGASTALVVEGELVE